MAFEGWTREDAWALCEREGEEAIRLNYEKAAYHGDLEVHVRSWLRSIDEKREATAEARREASRVEEMRIARSAKNAAWVAAMSAIAAIVISIISLVLSLRSAARL